MLSGIAGGFGLGRVSRRYEPRTLMLVDSPRRCSRWVGWVYSPYEPLVATLVLLRW